jgi:hypothetical protein
MKNRKWVIWSSLFLLSAGAVYLGATLPQKNKNLTVNLENQNLILAGESGEKVEVLVRNAQGQVLHSQKLTLNSGANSIAVKGLEKGQTTAYVSVSHESQIENFKVQNQKLVSLKEVDSSEKTGGLRDQLIVKIQKQFALMPDQTMLLEKILATLSVQNKAQNGVVYSQIQKSIASDFLHLSAIISQNGHTEQSIRAELDRQGLDFGSDEAELIQNILKFDQSLSSSQKDKAQLLKLIF